MTENKQQKTHGGKTQTNKKRNNTKPNKQQPGDLTSKTNNNKHTKNKKIKKTNKKQKQTNKQTNNIQQTYKPKQKQADRPTWGLDIDCATLSQWFTKVRSFWPRSLAMRRYLEHHIKTKKDAQKQAEQLILV